MPTYWDTSCVLKLYCPEPDSDRYLDFLAADAAPPVSSVLTKSEFIFALQQKAMRKELGPAEATRLQNRFLADLDSGHLALMPFGSDVQSEATRIARICYRRKPPIPLRTLDGLHLATAVLAKCRILVTADERMGQAARILNFDLV